MALTMGWFSAVIRVAVAPVLVGAVAMVVDSPRAPTDIAAVAGLLVLSAIHVIYWWRPWQTSQWWALAALGGMVLTDFLLLHLLALDEPLLWLYPALIAGAGLSAPAAAIGVGMTALAAAAPIAVVEKLVHPLGAVPPSATLGPTHSVLVSIVLAGLGMAAVRQLITLNEDLQATRADLADLAVAAERGRLARELHDLLGRTLSLIAVKAELASRLSARGDASSASELADVQRLARQAVRDVREAVSGAHAPTVHAELAAAETALRMAGIRACVENNTASVDPAHESTLAWAIREGVTNVLRHSQARACRISLDEVNGTTTLAVVDDGRGRVVPGTGTGLDGLAGRVQALDGSLDAGPLECGGFRLRVCLGAGVPRHARIERVV